MHNRSKHTYRASLFFLLLILLFGSSCLLTGCSGGTSSKADSSDQKRTDAYASLVPTASGETCYGVTAFPSMPPTFPMAM